MNKMHTKHTLFLRGKFLAFAKVIYRAGLFGLTTKALLFTTIVSVTVVTAQTDDADLIIQKVRENKAVNDPFGKSQNLKFTQYRQIKITGNPETILGNSKKSEVLRSTLRKSHVFLSEKVSDFYSLNGDLREVVRGVTLSGFDEPVYRIYTVEVLSQSLYDEHYIIFDTEYAGPVDDNARYHYNYSIAGDTIVAGRSCQKIRFTPKKEDKIALLEGILTVDSKSYAIAGARIRLNGGLRVNALHTYDYDVATTTWLPQLQDLYIVQSDNQKKIALLGGQVAVGRLEDIPDDEEGAEVQQLSQNLYLRLTSYNTDFVTGEEPDVNLHGIKTYFKEGNSARDSARFWNKYRKIPLNIRDLQTFTEVDSLVEAQNIPRKLKRLDKFKEGYYPLGPVDVDLKSVIKFNQYESLRLGLGIQTSDQVFENVRLGGYAAYGFGDEAFKFGLNGSLRLDRETDSWFKVSYQDDITELASSTFTTDARVYSVFEPRLINITTFYGHETYQIALQQRLHPKVLSEFSLSRKRINQTTPYRYFDEGLLYRTYVLSEFTVAARWAPFSEFMFTQKGYFTSRKGYPVLSLQLTKGVDRLLESDFDYFKASAKAYYQIDRLDKSKTELFAEGHFATGNVPLTHLYHAYPNAPNREAVLQRFSVAGRRSFETMYFNEFFSDRLFVSQIRHSFSPWNLTTWSKPQIVAVSRFAIGDLEDKDKHLNIGFNTLEHGYLESGLEFNQLIYGFGLGLFYRYGAYSLDEPADNLAVKFTFFLDL